MRIREYGHKWRISVLGSHGIYYWYEKDLVWERLRNLHTIQGYIKLIRNDYSSKSVSLKDTFSWSKTDFLEWSK